MGMPEGTVMPTKIKPVPHGLLEMAACKPYPTDWWFPSHGQSNTKNARKARAICAECPVIEACRQYADTTPVEQWGIWAGQDRKGRQQRRAKRKPPGPVAGRRR